MKRLLLKIGLFILIIVAFFGLKENPAQALLSTSDRISTSQPGIAANHSITFTTIKAIPPSGKIVIIPQVGQFNVLPGFDYNDVDVAVSTMGNSFVDRDVSAIADNMFDAVAISGSTSTDRQITITLNSTTGIAAGDKVNVELGLNADYNYTGDHQILNPVNTGSFGFTIATYDNNNVFLENSRLKVAILEPVSLGASMIKTRSYPTPSGVLEYGTVSSIMSIVTNFRSVCRYSTASNTSYMAMTDVFSVTGDYFHSTLLTGFLPGTRYYYFIRCRDTNGVFDDPTLNVYAASSTPYYTASNTPILEVTERDFYITFLVSGQSGSGSGTNGTSTNPGTGTETGDGSGSGTGGSGSTGGGSSGGGGAGGGGGSGGGGGGGLGDSSGSGSGVYLPYPPLPGEPGVVITGWSFGAREVNILMDGQNVGKAIAQPDGTFGAFLKDLTQGNYTFGVAASDSQNRQSMMHSATFYIRSGTQTTLSGVIIAPTVDIGKSTVKAGELITVSGESVPNVKLIIELYPSKAKVLASEIIKTETNSNASGAWSVSLDSSKLKDGAYKIKVRAYIDTVGYGDYSYIKDIQVGAAVEKNTGICAGADLNKDGKVNITDFSILLYYWGTDNACADQNKSGKVDLIDFSIMMYYWTG